MNDRNRHERRAARARNMRLHRLLTRLTAAGLLPDELTGDIKALLIKAIHKAVNTNKLTKAESAFMRSNMP